MPRKSPDAIAAAYLRTGGKPMPPPDHLEPDVAAIWRVITASRPPDFFNPGCAPLLEQYCTTLVMCRFYARMWRERPKDRDYVRSVTMLNTSLSMLATKLRLANTSIDKRAGILTERGSATEERDGKVLLFGGPEVRF
jgi:hypothetical protein